MVTVESTFTKQDILRDLSPQTPFVLYGISWDDYEEVVRELDGSSVQTIYNHGILKVMSKSSEHEYFIELIKRIIDRVSFILLKKVIFFGSPTIKQSFIKKGVEPDACFYVSRANLVSGQSKIDVSQNVPDIVVEVDIHHSSEDNFEIYSAFGVSEFWLYDGNDLKIYQLKDGKYIEITASAELSNLTSASLTEFLNRSKTEDQFELLIEFENKLKNNEL
ncbi:MAG: Uma2 family endonuclease [Pyrinomonadaceae bacterium]|nr:Uma2 family endonuclease [Pyrinomonadaceae bacterium]